MTAIVETKTQRRRRTYRRNKKIRRAIEMIVEYVRRLDDDFIYSVNGERRHLVKIGARPFDSIVSCDCNNAKSPCSHVIAVRMFRGEWK